MNPTKERRPVSEQTYPYRPDYAVPPGETLRSTLEALGMSQIDLARRSGVSAKHINQIVGGQAPISPEVALGFERVLRVPARFWSALEANYQARLLRIQASVLSPEDEAWLAQLPIKEMRQRDLIEANGDKSSLYEEILSFFGVASRSLWESLWLAPEVSFRRSPVFAADPHATAVWLRSGELAAQEIPTEPFDRSRFQAALAEIRGLMVEPPERFEPRMTRLCADSGVALVVVEEIKGSRASGAARWIASDKALIQLSLRYRWEDVFWFSFFHEAAHVLLHGKRESFVDDGSAGSEAEDQANRMASDFLIPQRFEGELLRLRTLADAQGFAARLRIPTGIVIGRMHREGTLPYHVGNRLRRRLAFTH